MYHNESIVETDISLIPLSLKFFAIFQMYLFYYKHNEEYNVVGGISIKCSNCHISTVLFLKDKKSKKLSLSLCYIHYCIVWVCLG